MDNTLPLRSNSFSLRMARLSMPSRTRRKLSNSNENSSHSLAHAFGNDVDLREGVEHAAGLRFALIAEHG